MRASKRTRDISAVAIIVVLLAGCAMEPHPLTGLAAPAVELELLDGGVLDLEAHRGKDIVILDFWATWCGPCRRYMPIIEEVAGEFADQGVALYAINSAEPAARVRRYVETTGFGGSVALDPSGSASIAYRAEALPQTVLIGRQGRIQKVYVGAGPGIEREIRRDLERLLSGKDLTQF